MTRQEREPVSSSKMSVSMPEDPFVILGATPKSEYSSFGLFSDYLDNITMPAKSENTKVDAPANTSWRFQGSDMFAGFPKTMPSFSFVSEKESDTTGRRSVNSVNSMSQSNHMPVQQGSAEATANILPEMNVSEQSVIHHEVPIVTGFQTLNPFAMDDPLPEKNEYSKMADDVWLTVSDITLVTQPTSAPPPSRPPPPLVTKQPPTESVTTKTFPHHLNQGYHHSVGSTVTLKSFQINELEDFFTPKSAKFANQHPWVLNHKGTEQYSSTGTANFLGQSDLRDSKGMDRGDFGSVFSSSQYQQEEIDEKSEFCVHEMEKMYGDELLENERRQREHDEDQRRAERERIEELEQEREKVRQREQEEKKRREKEREARQAVERAIREARERAAVEARMRAESEACQRAERAAVQKATAEARERAAVEAKERVAKSAAEAKERATADARERDARAAAEAREKAAAESQDKATAEAQAKAERAAVEEAAAEAVEKAIREARERAAVEARMRAESEARRRAERAAVQKATAEARERAAVEARERAAEAKERATEEARKKATRAAAEAREKAVAESQEKAAAEARAKAERAAVEKATAEARRRAERAAFERVAAEARQRAAVEAQARENQQKTATVQPDLESFFGMPSGSNSVPKPQTATTVSVGQL
jgi:membrane protein involved in colicin uptake